MASAGAKQATEGCEQQDEVLLSLCHDSSLTCTRPCSHAQNQAETETYGSLSCRHRTRADEMTSRDSCRSLGIRSVWKRSVHRKDGQRVHLLWAPLVLVSLLHGCCATGGVLGM